MKRKKDIKYIDVGETGSARSSHSLSNSRSSGKPRSSDKSHSPKKTRLTLSRRVGSVMAVVGTTFLTMLLIAIITTCIVAVALTVYVMQFAENSFDIDLREAEMNFTTLIMAYDPNAGEDGGGEYVEVKRISGDENRIWTPIENIPQILIDAIVANEDHRYFEHEGVDWYGTAGVTINAFFSDSVRGASTITQQLVKNVTHDDKVTAGRKLREIFRALSLEQKYTKLDILESYLNRIGFGGTSCGVQSAAWYYFDKDVSEISIAEAALMAAVIPSPHNYNPYNNAKLARERQEIALGQMYYHGFITAVEYEQALAEQVRFRRAIEGDHFGYVDERYHEWAGLQGASGEHLNLYYEDTPWEDILPRAYKWNGDYEITQNWYVDAAIWQVATHLSEMRGVSYERALELLRNGGFTIYLNVNMEMQEKLEELALDPMTFLRFPVAPETPSTDLLQGAFVVMDYSGRVVALAGGFGEKPGDNCLNRATSPSRSIGSTIKPLSLYAPAVDMNVLTYSTYTRDISGIKRVNPNDPNSPTEYWPYNFGQTFPGSGRYHPTWYSVQKSHNTVAVRTLSKIGFQASYNMLSDRLGFSDLDSISDMNWSPLALGAITHGVRLHELTAAYAIFGNGGIYYEPYMYDRVVDHNGRIVLEQNLSGKRAIESDTAWIVNRMLKKVVDDPDGSSRNAMIPDIEVIGKTGTSNDMKNLLFCAMTPEYVASYRFGYDNAKEMNDFAYDNWIAPARVWGHIMGELSDNSTPKRFTPDGTVIELSYCKDTGMIATSRCMSTEIGYYRATNIPPSCDATVHDGWGGTYWATHGDAEDFRPFYN
ncbi:MAG: transglycosylase domain-containing protein [Oscillospiraceae bacterium]|nr:transglycosylase domain-containing protein [Oscillospiraceae bacterium]